MCYTPRTQNKLVLRTIGILIEEDSVHGYLSLPRCSQEVKRALTSGKLYCRGCIQECICISICITCICLRMSIQQLSSGPMSQLLLEFNNTYLLIQLSIASYIYSLFSLGALFWRQWLLWGWTATVLLRWNDSNDSRENYTPLGIHIWTSTSNSSVWLPRRRCGTFSNFW